MARYRQLRKIIWAFDPFEEESVLSENAVRTLKTLSERTQAAIQPVYLLSAAELNLSVEFAPAWVDQYRPATRAAMKERLSRLDLPNVSEPQVLVQNSGSKRAAIKALSHHAEAEHADMILVSTHAREGVSRFLLGSFAETLLLHSHVPVLVVGPERTQQTGFRKILFPTDLGEYSRSLFEQAVGMAKEMGAKLTVFHAIPSSVEAAINGGLMLFGGGWTPVRSYFSEEGDQRHRKVEAMVHWANKRGVETDFLIDDQGGSVTTSLIGLAERSDYDLIAMAAESGPITTTLIGSITRQVVRHAPCPVWIIHPPRRKEAKKSAA